MSASRKLLAIESATDWLSVALLEGDDVIEARRSDARMQHAAALLPAIDETLRAAAMRLDDLDALAISTGPGSFTSLRIGLATLKGLAFRRDLDTLGVSTLEAMALLGMENASLRGVDEVVSLLDARRGQWYAGGWTRPGHGSAPTDRLPGRALAEGLYAPERVAAALDVNRSFGFVAPQPGAWLAACSSIGIDVRLRIEGEAARPDAVWVGRLAQRRLDAGEGVPASELGARYLRRAEAEAKRLGGPVERGEIADLGGAEQSN